MVEGNLQRDAEVLLVVGAQSHPARVKSFVPILLSMSSGIHVFSHSSRVERLASDFKCMPVPEATLSHHLCLFGHRYRAVIFSDIACLEIAYVALAQYCPNSAVIVDGEGAFISAVYPWAQSAAFLRSSEVLPQGATMLCSSKGESEDFQERRAHSDIRIVWTPTNIDGLMSSRDQCTGPRVRESKRFRIVIAGDFRELAEAEGLFFFINEVVPLLEDLSVDLLVCGQAIPPLHQLKIPVYRIPLQTNAASLWRDANCLLVSQQRYHRQKVEVLYSFHEGIPVVLNSYAASHFAVSDGKEVIIANSPTSVANAIRVLKNDVSLASRIGSLAAEYCRDNHQQAVTAHAFASIFSELIPAKVALEAPV